MPHYLTHHAMGKKAGKVALGLGLIAGAVTGLLFAPEEGKKIRKKIAKGDTKGIVDDVYAMGHDIKDMVSELAKEPSVVDAVDKAKGKAAEVANIKREELDKILADANKKAEKFKKAVAKYVKSQKAALDKKYNRPKAKRLAPKKSKKPTVKKKVAAKKKTVAKKKAPAKKKTTKKK